MAAAMEGWARVSLLSMLVFRVSCRCMPFLWMSRVALLVLVEEVGAGGGGVGRQRGMCAGLVCGHCLELGVPLL